MAIGAIGSGIAVGTQQFIDADRLVEDRARKRVAADAFDFSLCRSVRVPTDGYVRHSACFYRAPVELVRRRVGLHASRDEVRNPTARIHYVPGPRATRLTQLTIRSSRP